MDQFYGKKYKYTKSENLDEYLTVTGVGLVMRKLATTVSPVCTLTNNGNGSYTLLMTTPVKNREVTFKLGEEFDEEKSDGVKVKSVVAIEGNKLIYNQTEKDGKKTQHFHEFSADILKVTVTVDGWDGKCIRIYELID